MENRDQIQKESQGHEGAPDLALSSESAPVLNDMVYSEFSVCFGEEAPGSFMLKRSKERVVQSLALVLSSVGWAPQACLHRGIKLGASNKQQMKG